MALRRLLDHRSRRLVRFYTSYLNPVNILGIETSCDDTGSAVVDSDGNILGEALKSQQITHLNHGGIIPPIAQKLHRENIEEVVKMAMEAGNLSFEQITAIAVTVKPGLPLSLTIGMKYGKHLSRTHKKPLIPIHHMEAHALTARMIHKDIQFPFLVLLISGGHCLLAVAKDLDSFLLLGKSLDDAPGEAFDKAARRLKLRNLPEYERLSGGRAIELAASKAEDPFRFQFPLPLAQYRDCNFSIAGLKNTLNRHIWQQEAEFNVEGDRMVPNFPDLCAGLQLAVAKHLCHRLHRAIEYAEYKAMIPNDRRALVVSGGVACNDFIFNSLKVVCDKCEYKIFRPPPKLCTDNGIMIAWNGVEKWKVQRGITNDLESVDIESKSPLGVSMINDVAAASIKCQAVRTKELYQKF